VGGVGGIGEVGGVGRVGGVRGEGGEMGCMGGQQLSTLHFISQIIKDDYRLPFQEIIILWVSVSGHAL
jgi:hypothetical protein